MASVKKTVKLSKTKQARKASSPKGKASKSPAEPKKKRKASARVLTVRAHAAAKVGRGAKSNARSAPSAAARPGSTASAKPAERKKMPAARGAELAAARSAKKVNLPRGVKTARPKRGPARKDAAAKAPSARLTKETALGIRRDTRQQLTEASRTTPSERARRVAGKAASVAGRAAGAAEPEPQRVAESRVAAAILSLKRKSAAQGGQEGHQTPATAPSMTKNPSSLKPPSHGRLAASSSPVRTGSAPSEGGAGGKSTTLKTGEEMARIPSQGPLKGARELTGSGLQILPGQGNISPEPNPNAAVSASGASHPAKPGFPARPAGHAQKPAKTASPPRPPFKLNEFVVYPTHGVGQIIAIEDQAVAGFTLELFVLSFVKDKMILKVPVTKAAAVGMRKLADAEGVKTALDILAGRARIKRTMWSRRAQEYEAKINSGDLNAIAEVVRDLYRSDTQPEQSYSERQLYEAAVDRMGREIAAVLKLTETEALKMIEMHLHKGPKRGKAEDAEADDPDIEEAA